MAILDHLAKESNDSLADLIVAQKDYALARSILAEAEVDARKAGAEISRKIDQATELRDLEVQAKDALDDKIRRLEGEAGVLRVTLEQRQQRQAGQVRGGGKCDLSGTSDAEYFIIMKESGGDPTADNPRSTAFGLGQLLRTGAATTWAPTLRHHRLRPGSCRRSAATSATATARPRTPGPSGSPTAGTDRRLGYLGGDAQAQGARARAGRR